MKKICWFLLVIIFTGCSVHRNYVRTKQMNDSVVSELSGSTKHISDNDQKIYDSLQLTGSSYPVTKPVIRSFDELFNFKIANNDPVGWCTYGYRGLIVFDRKTGAKTETGLGGLNAEISNVFIADTLGKILFIELADHASTDSLLYGLYNVGGDSLFFRNTVESCNIFPYYNNQLLVQKYVNANRSNYWFVCDMYFNNQHQDSLALILNKYNAALSFQRNLVNLSPQEKTKLSEDEKMNLMTIGDFTTADNLNLKRNMLAGYITNDYEETITVSVRWNPGVKDVILEPYYAQKYPGEDYLDNFRFSPDGSIAVNMVTETDYSRPKKNTFQFDSYEEYTRLIFHICGDPYDQGISIAIDGGNYDTDEIVGEFFYSKEFGLCYVTYNMLNMGKLLIYPVAQIKATPVSRSVTPREYNTRQDIFSGKYQTINNGKSIVTFSDDHRGLDFKNIQLSDSMISVNFTQSLKFHEFIYSYAISDDMNYVAASDWNFDIKLFIRKDSTFETIVIPDAHSGFINQMVFTDDNKYLFTCSSDRQIKMWDTHGKLVKEFSGHFAPVNRLCISEKNRVFTSCDVDSTVILWDFEGNLLRRIYLSDGDIYPVLSMAISDDKNKIAIGTDENIVYVYNIENQELRTLTSCDNPGKICFSPDNRFIVCLNSQSGEIILLSDDGRKIHSFDNKLFLFKNNLWSQTIENWLKAQGVYKIINTSQYTSNLKSLGPEKYVSTHDNTILIFDKDFNLIHTLKGHDSEIMSIDVSPDNKYIASVGYDKKLNLWDADGNQIRTIYGFLFEIRDMFFASDSTIVLASYCGISRWSVDGTLLEQREFETDPAGFDPERKRMIVQSNEGETPEMRTFDNELLVKFSDYQTRCPVANQWYAGELFPNNLLTAKFSPSGKYVLFINEGDIVEVHRTDGARLVSLQTQNYMVNTGVFSPSEKYVAIRHFAGKLRTDGSQYDYYHALKVFSLEDGRLIKDFSNIESFQFSGDEKYIVTVEEGLVKFWLLDTIPDYKLEYIKAIDKNPKTTEILEKPIFSFKVASGESCSASEKYIAIGGDAINLYLIQAGRRIKHFGTGRNIIDMTTDGKFLVSGDDDGEACLWDIETGYRIWCKQIYTEEYKSSIRNVAADDSNGVVAIHKYNAEGEKAVIDILNFRTGEKLFSLTGHNDNIQTMSISANGQYLVSGSRDKTIILWDLKNKKQIWQSQPEYGDITQVIISSDNRYVIAACAGYPFRGDVSVFDLQSGQRTWSLINRSEGLIGVQLTGDNKILIIADKKVAHLIDFNTKKIIKTYYSSDSYIRSIQVIGNNKLLIQPENNKLQIRGLDKDEYFNKNANEADYR